MMRGDTKPRSGGSEAPMLSLDAMGQLLVLASQASVDDAGRCMVLLSRKLQNPVRAHERDVAAGRHDDLRPGESLEDASAGRVPMTARQLEEARQHAEWKSAAWNGRDTASVLDVLYHMTNCFDNEQLCDLIDLWAYYQRGKVAIYGSHMLGYWGQAAGDAVSGAQAVPRDGPADAWPGIEYAMPEPDGPTPVFEPVPADLFEGGSGPDGTGDDTPDYGEAAYDEADYLSLDTWHDTFEPC